MFRAIFSLGIALAFASLAQAQTMPLNQFLNKATELEKKGVMAMFSSQASELKRELSASSKLLKAERLAASAEGKKPAFCPPEKSSITNIEIMTHFRGIPAAERDRMRTKDAFRSLLAKKYPCPGLNK